MKTWLMTGLLLCLTSLPAHSMAAKAETQPVASSYDTGAEQTAQQPFRLIILGTRKAADIELIRKNIQKLAYVKLFIPTTVSQRHLEFEGKYLGDAVTLIADVESLALNRYDVTTKEKTKHGLRITLRKIQAPPSSAVSP